MSFNDLEQGLPNGPIHIDTDNDDRLFKDLAQRIAQQTFHINGNIASIERLVNLLGTNRDSVEVRNNLHDVTLATRDLIKDSTLDLKSLSSINLNDPKSRQRRLEQQKLSKDFQKVVAHFQTIQKASASKQREFIDKTKATTVMLQNQVEEEEIEQQQQLNGQRQAQIEALDHEIEYNELLIHDRENEIQNIEQGIGELNEIFRDMGMLVNEQESGIQSIYGNVLSIAQNTRQAADELVIANHHHKNARRNMCCFLLIISIVGCILALIIVIAK